ncbi:MAG: DUF1385 domain-containing protein [Clostridia bacterium]|nr:DUF1385 domain-containing protein [Clostridia bacterium]
MNDKEKCCARRKTSIGGQALMEGIMMRGPEKNAMAVRRANGEIVFEESLNQKKKRPRFCRWPVIRGVFGFIDSLAIGYKALMRSAEIAMEDELAEEEKKSADEPVAEPAAAVESAEKEEKKGFSKGAMAAVMVIATVLGFALAIGLFIWLPSFLYNLIAKYTPAEWELGANRYLRSVFEGILKILVLVLYMALVSLMKDIRRTFMYHGAEHKTIFCYEKGIPLTVENVKKQRRFHPRCGTSFLILMLLVSIVIGLFIPPTFEGINPTLYTVIRAAIKLLLIPLTMGIGYELLKFAGKHENILTRIISAPGMWLQRITVKEPTDDMIECAIKAFVAVLPEEEMEAEIAAAKEQIE